MRSACACGRRVGGALSGPACAARLLDAAHAALSTHACRAKTLICTHTHTLINTGALQGGELASSKDIAKQVGAA